MDDKMSLAEKKYCIETFQERRLFLFTLFAENFTKNIARWICVGYTNVKKRKQGGILCQILNRCRICEITIQF